MPADILGTSILKPGTDAFTFHAGPVFTDLLLVDEINRMPPRTQAALLECMEERQVTADGVRHPLPEWFTVFATQNPVDFEGTYPLPEAQLDRFLLKIRVAYPTEAEEMQVLEMHHGVRHGLLEGTTLDGFCCSHGIQLIDVLKIDAEGCDLLVLQGAQQLLSTGRVRFVHLEFNDMSPRAGSTGGALTPVSDLLVRFGFRFVATYPDYMELGDEMHVGANVLFVHPPSVATQVVA